MWQDAKRTGEYRADTLSSQGFIHCSTPGQLIGVANLFYKGRSDLVLLSIDSKRVKAEIRYERVGEIHYPHIYGPLNIDAVIKVQQFRPNPHGTFDPLVE